MNIWFGKPFECAKKRNNNFLGRSAVYFHQLLSGCYGLRVRFGVFVVARPSASPQQTHFPCTSRRPSTHSLSPSVSHSTSLLLPHSFSFSFCFSFYSSCRRMQFAPTLISANAIRPYPLVGECNSPLQFRSLTLFLFLIFPAEN